MDTVARKIFISYIEKDRQWAEWVAWETEAAGHEVRFGEWDFGPGTNLGREMDAATKWADVTLMVLSEEYLASELGQAQWYARFVGDAAGVGRSLLPVMVSPCTLDGLLAAVVPLDLVDVAEDLARERLAMALGGERGKPAARPAYPDRERAPFPRARKELNRWHFRRLERVEFEETKSWFGFEIVFTKEANEWREFGPHSREEIFQFLLGGSLPPDGQIRCQDRPDWSDVQEVDFFGIALEIREVVLELERAGKWLDRLKDSVLGFYWNFTTTGTVFTDQLRSIDAKAMHLRVVLEQTDEILTASRKKHAGQVSMPTTITKLSLEIEEYNRLILQMNRIISGLGLQPRFFLELFCLVSFGETPEMLVTFDNSDLIGLVHRSADSHSP